MAKFWTQEEDFDLTGFIFETSILCAQEGAVVPVHRAVILAACPLLAELAQDVWSREDPQVSHVLTTTTSPCVIG